MPVKVTVDAVEWSAGVVTAVRVKMEVILGICNDLNAVSLVGRVTATTEPIPGFRRVAGRSLASGDKFSP